MPVTARSVSNTIVRFNPLKNLRLHCKKLILLILIRSNIVFIGFILQIRKLFLIFLPKCLIQNKDAFLSVGLNHTKVICPHQMFIEPYCVVGTRETIYFLKGLPFRISCLGGKDMNKLRIPMKCECVKSCDKVTHRI